MKIFRKEKTGNGRRHIYFCGIKIVSYKKHKHNHSIPHIDKNILDVEIAEFNSNGINRTKRDKKIIVSLTSFPQRMKDIHYAIFSLLKQTVKPDKIILWLGKDKFPNKEQDLPETLLNLKKFGLTIKWCKDIRSYTKLIPALKEYPDDIIITVDDDIYYPEYLVEKLYKAYLKNKNMVHCLRAHKIKFNQDETILPYNDWEKCIQNVKPSFNNFLTGVGGVLYPPKCL
ncbi:MAG: hypothetical protein IJL23_03465, partial [Alphaproteobacteria bacterium]|nr:hypothetical protein [Alphaproteobacteria bacterium]